MSNTSSYQYRICAFLIIYLLGTAAIATTQVYAQQSSPAPQQRPPQQQQQQPPDNASPPADTDSSAPKLLTLPPAQANPQTTEKVISLQEQGDRLFARQQYAQALIKWQEAYGTSLEIGYSDGQGRALTGMCQLYVVRGQVIKAKELGENAIEVLSNTNDKLSLGKARVALAQAYFSLDNAVSAAQQLELALKTFADLGDKDAANTAKVMQLIGSVLVKQDKVKEAVPFFQGAATFFGQAGSHYEEMSIRTSLVALMEQLGLYIASLEEAQKAVEAARAMGEPVCVCDALMLLGNAQYNLCEFAAARKSFEAALAIQPAARQELNKANLYMAYGCTLVATGDVERGLKFLTQAHVVMKQKAPVFSQAQLLNSMGVIEELLNNHEQASRFLEQALELQSISNTKRDRLHIVILENLAAVESRSGHGRAAVLHLQNALAIAAKNFPLLSGRINTSLAQVMLTQKDYESAQKYLHDGIALSANLDDDAALWQDYTLLAQIKTTDHATVSDLLKSALSYFRSPQAAFFPSAEELGYAVSRTDMTHRLISELISSGMTESAYLAANQLKEEHLASEWSRRGGMVKPEDTEIYSDLTSQKAHLHAAEASTTPNRLLSDWKSWIQRYQRLANENRRLARLITPAPLSYDAVRKMITSNKLTLVDYCVGNNETFVFTIDPKGDITARSLSLGAKDLENRISGSGLVNSNAAAESATDTGNTAKKTLQVLYGELFPPDLADTLPSNPEQVIAVIPDGVLFDIPFAALVTPKGSFLIQDHTLTIAPSVEALTSNPSRYSPTLSILVAAAPLNDGSAPAEATVISNLFEANTAVHILGKDIDGLQEQARGKAILHFPNHVTISDSDPFRSLLPVAGHGSDTVTANALFDLALPNDLVVLSKTSIDGQDIKGSAVRIFYSGLQYAGVRNVLMSLWVEPEAQRIDELVEFYKNNQKGLNQAQSLRQAQLLAMSKDPSVKSWAAFQLIGPGN